MAKVKVVHREVGRTTKVGINATWIHLFEQNEKAGKNSKMTDAEITKEMNRQFPSKKSAVFGRVQFVRNLYNHGKLTQGKNPKVKSYRYDESGIQVSIHRGRQAGTSTKPKARVKVKARIRRA